MSSVTRYPPSADFNLSVSLLITRWLSHCITHNILTNSHDLDVVLNGLQKGFSITTRAVANNSRRHYNICSKFVGMFPQMSTGDAVGRRANAPIGSWEHFASRPNQAVRGGIPALNACDSEAYHALNCLSPQASV